MYHIHRTPAYVARLYPRGEADMVATLCTREYGVVSAIAKGVRKETAKLRYVLQELTCLYVELVRGKEMWRITSVQPVLEGDAIYHTPLTHKEDILVLARCIDVLRRLGGEEALPQAFDDIQAAVALMLSGEVDRFALEATVVARLLSYLGYVDTRTHTQVYSEAITPETLEYAKTHRDALVFDINTALAASQLN